MGDETELGEPNCRDSLGVPVELAVLRRFWIEHNKDELTRPEGASFRVGEVIRMPHYATSGGYRVWVVNGVHLGGDNQEGTYSLTPVDISQNKQIHVPCIVLETHPEIERVA